jgi:fumarate hydratase class II
MMSKLARKRVVAEVNKNWTSPDDEKSGLISEMFERVIADNLKRGFELESWQYQSNFIPKNITETIVAVFVELNPDPRQDDQQPKLGPY